MFKVALSHSVLIFKLQLTQCTHSKHPHDARMNLFISFNYNIWHKWSKCAHENKHWKWAITFLVNEAFMLWPLNTGSNMSFVSCSRTQIMPFFLKLFPFVTAGICNSKPWLPIKLNCFNLNHLRYEEKYCITVPWAVLECASVTGV